MKLFSKAIQSVRGTLLSIVNRRRLRWALSRMQRQEDTPIFFIFTPDVVHFAPYCIPYDASGFEPILVLNSVSSADQEWLKALHPNNVIVALRVSLTGNAKSMLSHGAVLNDLFAIADKPFCIQDPDCFVTHSSFWSQVRLDVSTDMACGPFTKAPTDHTHVLPDTFFLIMNPALFKTLARRYRISASSAYMLPAAQEAIRHLDYQPGEYPEQFKGYFDTLQAFWLLALSEGYEFRKLPGEGESVFHIGGTSYLHSSDYDLKHWDYWPLSVIYFNLSLLALPHGKRFHERFQGIMNGYSSPDNLLREYPAFMGTRRFAEIKRLLGAIAG